MSSQVSKLTMNLNFPYCLILCIPMFHIFPYSNHLLLLHGAPCFHNNDFLRPLKVFLEYDNVDDSDCFLVLGKPFPFADPTTLVVGPIKLVGPT